MNQTQAPEPRQIRHFVIDPDTYSRVTQLLGDIPYKWSAVPLEVLTQGTRAVFKKSDGEGEIVETDPEPHVWRYHAQKAPGEKQSGFFCQVCKEGHITEDPNNLPPPGPCLGPPAGDGKSVEAQLDDQIDQAREDPTTDLRALEGEASHIWIYSETMDRFECQACPAVFEDQELDEEALQAYCPRTVEIDDQEGA